MSKARAILRRRKSVQSICKITRTMQLIANTKLRVAMRRTLAARPRHVALTGVVLDLVAEVRDAGRSAHPMLAGRADARGGTVGVIVLTNDRGLAGA